LYGLGARKVAFNGLPPLGCIPAQRVKSATGECLDHVNGYAVQFNAAAKKLLDGMNARLPGAQMALADCYSVVMELIQHPQKHGKIGASQPSRSSSSLCRLPLLTFGGARRVQGSRRRTRRAAAWTRRWEGSACRTRRPAATARRTCSGTPTTPRTPPTGSSPTASGTT
jgi:hypothetical protein